MNDTQKEMRQGAEEFAARQKRVEKAMQDAVEARKKVHEEAKAKLEAIDAGVRAVAHGEPAVSPVAKHA